MFHHDRALEHVLKPQAYSDARNFDREIKHLFRPAWHFAALQRDLAREGSQVARDVAGVPVVIRNEGGELRAFLNVCAHRHCMIVREGCSQAKALRCQYHGWEYGHDGRLTHLPDGRSFKGLEARQIALDSVRVETLGPLVLVNLDAHATGFLDALGDFGEELVRFFGDHRVIRVWSTDHAVNWKLIAENAVESYHVPLLHPGSFRDFRAPELHEHTLHPNYTRYLDLKPWENDVVGLGARLLARVLLRKPTMRRFTQAHVFPGLLLYYGDLVSTLIALEPLGPTSTRHIAISFVPRGIRGGALLRPLQDAFGFVFTTMGERILREDMKAWPAIQHGLDHSRAAGVLGAREERVYAFQRWVAERLETSAS